MQVSVSPRCWRLRRRHTEPTAHPAGTGTTSGRTASRLGCQKTLLTDALPATEPTPTALSASISAMPTNGLPGGGSSENTSHQYGVRTLGHAGPGLAQPESVPALLRQLGLSPASVVQQADALRAWLSHNVPTRQLRISMRQNGYGILLDRQFGRTRGPLPGAWGPRDRRPY